MRNRLSSSLLLCLLLSPLAFTQTPTLGLSAPQLCEKGMNNLMGMSISRSDLNAVEYLRRSSGSLAVGPSLLHRERNSARPQRGEVMAAESRKPGRSIFVEADQAGKD